MKTLSIIFLAIVVISLTKIHLIAQENKIIPDSLKTGKIYKVQIENGWETEGRLIKIDSGSIDIKSEFKIFTIQKSEIENITMETSQFQDYNNTDTGSFNNKFKNEKFYLSLGSGINIAPSWFGNEYYHGVNLQLNIMKIMSPGHAIRGDFQFSHNSRIRNDYYEGGDLNSYSLKFDFLLGNFKLPTRVNGYVILGGGLYIYKESEVKHNYEEYSYKNEARNYINLEAGGGLSYKISERLNLYSEGLYSFPFAYMGKSGGASLYGIFYGYPSLKIGVQLEL